MYFNEENLATLSGFNEVFPQDGGIAPIRGRKGRCNIFESRISIGLRGVNDSGRLMNGRESGVRRMPGEWPPA